MREYAQDRLEHSGTAENTRLRMAQYFTQLAEQAASGLSSAEKPQAPLLSNIQAALGTATYETHRTAGTKTNPDQAVEQLVQLQTASAGRRKPPSARGKRPHGAAAQLAPAKQQTTPE